MMTQAMIAASEEIRWFYLEAAAACGMRSIQGAHEEMLQSGVKREGGKRWLDDGPTERTFEAWSRARAVWSRLALLRRRDRLVLESHYQDARLIGGEPQVSITLASIQPIAIASHRAAVQAAVRAIAKARSESKPLSAASRLRGRQRPTVGMTAIGWIVRLSSSDDDAQVKLRETIIDAARAELEGAIERYVAIAERAEAA
jgi:hypothetical protein